MSQSFPLYLIKFYFSKGTVVGTCFWIFNSNWAWGVPILGISSVNYLNFGLWNQHNKYFTEELPKGCPGQGTASVQSFIDNSWAYERIVENLLFIICVFVKIRLLCLSQTLPLDQFFLALPPFCSLGLCLSWPMAPFLSSLGDIVELREQLLPL